MLFSFRVCLAVRLSLSWYRKSGRCRARTCRQNQNLQMQNHSGRCRIRIRRRCSGRCRARWSDRWACRVRGAQTERKQETVQQSSLQQFFQSSHIRGRDVIPPHGPIWPHNHICDPWRIASMHPQHICRVAPTTKHQQARFDHFRGHETPAMSWNRGAQPQQPPPYHLTWSPKHARNP